MSLWFYANQVTINNGSTVVEVTSGEDVSIISAGDGLIVGSFSPVEIKRAYIDGSNNKFIELALAWEDSNQTNVNARAYYTAGDFIAATKALQDANILINDNFSSLDDWGSNAGSVSFVNQAGETKTARTMLQMDADVQAIQDGNQSIIDTSVSDSISAIRYGKLDSPLVHLFKKNKLVDTLKGELSWTRDSGATYIDQYGKLQYSPSPYATNLLTYSEDFSNAAWSNINGIQTITQNSHVAPDGTLTASTLTSDGALASMRSFSLSNTSVKGTIYTGSIFIKKGTSNLCKVEMTAYSGGVTQQGGFIYDFTTGVFSAIQVGTIPNIEKLDNGWYRVSAKASKEDAANTIIRFGVGANTTNVGETVLVWGAQIEVSRVANGYVKTEGGSVSGSSYVGIDITRQEKEVWLFEGASTNLLTYSEDFSNVNWVKNGDLTVSTSNIVSPDGSLTAFEMSTFSASGANHLIQTVAITDTGQDYTLSCFCKKGTSSSLSLRLFGNGGTTLDTISEFNFDTETFSGNSGSKSQFKKLNDGWYRVSMTATMNGTNTSLQSRIYHSSSEFGLTYIYGAQTEALPFVSSYIPTKMSAATRVSGKNSIKYEGNVPRGDQPFTLVFSGVIDGYTSYNRLFDTNSTTVDSRLYVFISASGAIHITNGDDTTIAVTSPITFGKRFTYIATFDGVTYKSYLNGVFQASSLAVSPAYVLPKEFRVMQGFNSTYASYGACSDFRVYDYPLNQLEISLLSGE
jgi:hypothetical protein